MSPRIRLPGFRSAPGRPARSAAAQKIRSLCTRPGLPMAIASASRTTSAARSPVPSTRSSSRPPGSAISRNWSAARRTSTRYVGSLAGSVLGSAMVATSASIRPARAGIRPATATR
jgi:hypothetical protein